MTTTRLHALCRLVAILLGPGLGFSSAQVAGAIAVYPQNPSIEGGVPRQFSAYVPISPNTIVWLVNDVVGGNATVGTISATGLYRPPSVIPSNNIVTIKARSTAYPSSSGSTTATITRKYPWLWSVAPSPIGVGGYSVSFNGSNFASDSQAIANGLPVQTTYVSPTKLIAVGTASQVGSLTFAVRQPGAGAVTGNAVSVKVVAPTVAVVVAPATASVGLGASRVFTVSVSGTTNAAVVWSVNGVAGGSAASGTIDAGGVYTAPTVMPSSSAVTIRATSVAAPAAAGQASVTLTAPAVSVTVAPATVALVLGATQSFTATVTGSGNTAVTWSVNGTVGGTPAAGTISAAGLYTAPAVMPASPSVTIRATAVASTASSAQAVVTLTSPPVPAASLSSARFLEQSSFGPSPATLARVQQIGIQTYLEEQFGAPETPILLPAGNSMGALRQAMMHTYSAAPDQLRQRVAYALSQILVTSGNKLVYADEMVPWLRLLSRHAFGNYRDLLRDVTVSPSMGKFLDLANSNKAGPTSGANENYPRELMQLFTIGLWRLNPDGSQMKDASGNPIPSYDQNTVREVARALTGWTYATAPGAAPRPNNWEYFGAPMEPRQTNHDTGAKVLLGCSLPAGRTVDQDLDDVIDCLMAHPNIAPFIATRLIRSLVMSNPSPGYIQRVADTFAGVTTGVRGDMKAVLRAVLLDPEARQDVAGPTQGRLKEPILQTAGLVRALNGQISDTEQFSYLFDNMSQSILAPPSVFGWFSPLYRVPNRALFGPEFQIYSATDATLRGNFFYALLTSPGSDVTIDLSPFQPYGNDMAGLVEAANQILLYGRMPAGMKQTIMNAAAPGYDAQTRMVTVLYLTVLSGQYAVQY